ncbi:MAG: hypothetical protein IPK39_16570 [Sulfuritalea sp.]|nr:hypothetical protein [Sulfuritalea sp.]
MLAGTDPVFGALAGRIEVPPQLMALIDALSAVALVMLKAQVGDVPPEAS